MSDQGAVELEVALHRRITLDLVAEVRLRYNDATTSDPDPQEEQIAIDLQELKRLEAEPERYAERLSDAFFAVGAVSTNLELARRKAVDTGRDLRVRLRTGPSALDLQSVRWEMLLDRTREGVSLVTQDAILFSRYLDSRDYRSIEVRPGQAVRALVAVAAPPTESLEPYEIDGRSFPPVDAEGEIARARKALDGWEVAILGEQEPVTLERFIECLSGTRPDVVYLVCHGYIGRSGTDAGRLGTRLLLQDEDGKAVHVEGRVLADRLRQFETLPSLMVLASCMSASSRTTDAGALVAVGPELAAVGVPAVIAMQDNVTMRTVEEMMPVLFGKLREQPAIDRAMAVARRHVRDRQHPDWWVPVLFMRLRSGRVWYEVPGFTGEIDHWTYLLASIDDGTVVPVLGPGLNDPFIGSRRELARFWAFDHQVPIASPRDEDLPQVAQYIARMYKEDYLRRSLRKALGRRLVLNFGPVLAGEIGAEAVKRLSVYFAKGAEDADPDSRHELVRAVRSVRRSDRPGESYESSEARDRSGDGASTPEDDDHEDLLVDLVRAVGRIARAADPHDPFRVLASLPLPVYVTTEASGLLADALTEVDRSPINEYFEWTAKNVWGGRPLKKAASSRGTPPKPLLLSLFGNLRMPGSVVLSEDHYFEFLTTFGDRATRSKRFPTQALLALKQNPLLLMGFRIDDWDFRVLIQAIKSLQSTPGEHPPGVAVQLDPEATSQQDPARIKSYVQEYFKQEFNIYWGSSTAFLRELATRREARR